MLSNLWTLTILPFLVSYGYTLLFAVVIALSIGLLAVFMKLLQPASDYLEALAQEHLSAKVAKRVVDCINKIENVLMDLISAEQNLIKTMAKEAYANDGVIDMSEVRNIAKVVAQTALTRLTPEMSTIKKYLAGNLVFEFIEDKVVGIVTQSVESLLSDVISSRGSLSKK